MNAAVKLIIGLILVFVGLALLVPSGWVPEQLEEFNEMRNVGDFNLDWSSQFVTVLQGSIPPFLVLIGILVVWIEYEELKAPEIPEIDEDFEIDEETEDEEEEEEE